MGPLFGLAGREGGIGTASDGGGCSIMVYMPIFYFFPGSGKVLYWVWEALHIHEFLIPFSKGGFGSRRLGHIWVWTRNFMFTG